MLTPTENRAEAALARRLADGQTDAGLKADLRTYAEECDAAVIEAAAPAEAPRE
jgi:hypothetical protein